MTPLFRTLMILWAFSLATTLLTQNLGEIRPTTVAMLLTLAGLKVRLILNDYLELSTSQFWRHSFNGVVSGFLILAFGIYLIPYLSG